VEFESSPWLIVGVCADRAHPSPVSSRTAPVCPLPRLCVVGVGLPLPNLSLPLLAERAPCPSSCVPCPACPVLDLVLLCVVQTLRAPTSVPCVLRKGLADAHGGARLVFVSAPYLCDWHASYCRSRLPSSGLVAPGGDGGRDASAAGGGGGAPPSLSSAICVCVSCAVPPPSSPRVCARLEPGV
jgi:hypothetical protein